MKNCVHEANKENVDPNALKETMDDSDKKIESIWICDYKSALMWKIPVVEANKENVGPNAVKETSDDSDIKI